MVPAFLFWFVVLVAVAACCFMGSLLIRAHMEIHRLDRMNESYGKLCLALRDEKSSAVEEVRETRIAVEEWKTEIRRVTTIRHKAEDVLRERNDRIDVLQSENTMLRAYWEAQSGKSNA